MSNQTRTNKRTDKPGKMQRHNPILKHGSGQTLGQIERSQNTAKKAKDHGSAPA